MKSVAWLYITRETIVTSGKKPIVALDDFKGVKIRGLNTLTDNALTAVGAAPSAMPGSEVYQALQSGVLDAGLTDLSAAVQPQVLRGAEVRHRRPDLHHLLPHVREPGVVDQALAGAPRTRSRRPPPRPSRMPSASPKRPPPPRSRTCRPRA